MFNIVTGMGYHDGFHQQEQVPWVQDEGWRRALLYKSVGYSAFLAPVMMNRDKHRQINKHKTK